MEGGELAYKKPSKMPEGDISRQEKTSAPALRITSRNVSSRRKALQDFYKISEEKSQQSDNQRSSNDDAPRKEPEELEAHTEEPDIASEIPINFENSEEVQKFLKLASIDNILKVRNKVSGKLLSQELTKKSIIYDNYYELIKLRQILDGVSKSSIVSTSSTDQNALDDLTKLNTGNESQNLQSVEQILGDLSNYINQESVNFNADFNSVVSNMVSKRNHLDSSASIIGIPEKGNEVEVDSKQLTDGITELLLSPKSHELAIKKLIDTIDTKNIILKKDLEALASLDIKSSH